jgi:hypothetical protein
VFQPPSATERIFNRAFGVLVRLGLGRRHNYLLQVRDPALWKLGAFDAFCKRRCDALAAKARELFFDRAR